jgi:hypothetical protein
MGRSVVDWSVRVAMMVLAGMVSLSILAAIATMTTDAGPRGFVAESPPQPLPEPGAEANLNEGAQPEAGNVFAPADRQAEGSGAGTVAAAPPPPREDRTERWLEAIAYALLALAGLVTIAILLLWRLVRELRRLADARG